MKEAPYPGYDVLDGWDSPSWNPQTRKVVERRLRDVPARRFLTAEEWRLLEVIVARVIPQPDRSKLVPITPWIDDKLCDDDGDGYRHDGIPPLRIAWREGLNAVRQESLARYEKEFWLLEPAAQDQLLTSIQRGAVASDAWAKVEPRRFFSEVLLRTIVGIYYAHPAAWSEIGFGGPASPRGYVRLGFDERDTWEAKLADYS